MTSSIIQTNKKCIECGSVFNLHLHHVMFGKNRAKSDEDGLVVWLCYDHLAETQWCWYYKKTTKDFIKRYGKNYL